MTDDEVLARVQALVAWTAGPDRTPPGAGPDTPLRDDGFWLDSIDLLDVIMACEQEFGVLFEGETDVTLEVLATARTLAALIVSKTRR